MVTKIQKWGNSQGLRLGKQVLEDARIAVGDSVDVAARDGVIVIAPLRRIRGKQSLQESGFADSRETTRPGSLIGGSQGVGRCGR